MSLFPNEALPRQPRQYHHRVFGDQCRECGRQSCKLTPAPLAGKDRDADDAAAGARAAVLTVVLPTTAVSFAAVLPTTRGLASDRNGGRRAGGGWRKSSEA